MERTIRSPRMWEHCLRLTRLSIPSHYACVRLIYEQPRSMWASYNIISNLVRKSDGNLYNHKTRDILEAAIISPLECKIAFICFLTSDPNEDVVPDNACDKGADITNIYNDDFPRWHLTRMCVKNGCDKDFPFHKRRWDGACENYQQQEGTFKCCSSCWRPSLNFCDN